MWGREWARATCGRRGVQRQSPGCTHAPGYCSTCETAGRPPVSLSACSLIHPKTLRSPPAARGSCLPGLPAGGLAAPAGWVQ